MTMSGFNEKLYSFCEKVMLLAYLNILWVVFSLVGGVLFGIYPSTIALFSLMKTWREGNSDKVCFQEYKRIFKSQFISGNRLGVYITILLGIMMLNGILLYFNQSTAKPLLFVLFIISFVLTVVLMLYVFPVYVYFRTVPTNTLVYALIIGMAHPLRTLYLSIISFLILVVVYSTAGLPIFFGVSVVAFIAMKSILPTLVKMEETGSLDKASQQWKAVN
ncbi:YesL family protein [Evansella vedderi]|nr:DUF624 domain-containing protein [Evansella vedderi]